MYSSSEAWQSFKQECSFLTPTLLEETMKEARELVKCARQSKTVSCFFYVVNTVLLLEVVTRGQQNGGSTLQDPITRLLIKKLT